MNQKMAIAQIQKLNPRHHKIIGLCLRGMTNQEIADFLNMSAQQISLIRKSPQFDVELARRRETVNALEDEAIVKGEDERMQEIRSHTQAAIARLGLSIDTAEKDADRIRAAAEILDRGGYPKTQRSEVKSLSVVIGPDDAKRITDTMEMDRL